MLKNKSLEDFNCVSDEQLFAELTPAEGATISAGFSTGVWTGNDGGTYFIRRDGDDVWWYGEGSKAWANVFRGTVNGDKLTGNWVDIPKRSSKGKGVLVLEKIDDTTFSKIFDTGGFSGSNWSLTSPGFP